MVEEIDQVKTTSLVSRVPIKFSSTPGGVRTAGPNLGAHGGSVEFGLN